jgi:hypothetical protein
VLAERLTIAWVDWYARSGPEPAATERRDEVASDVFEHLHQTAPGDAATQRALLGRLIRGIPDDVAWRVGLECHAERLTWHVAHPQTVLGVCWFLLLPVGLLADAGRQRLPGLWPVEGWLIGAVICLSTVAVALGLVAAGRALTEVRPLLRVGLRQWRTRLFCALAFFWALSGLWRSAETFLAPISNLAWAAFGWALILYVVVRIADFLRPRRTLDFEHISS